MSSLSESEAKEFHSAYVTGLLAYVGIAIVAHYLLYVWKPWF
jgi:light-harvesting complex 1 beta chain